jgi:N-acetylglucosamine-6-phosphate deacetylase
MTNSGPYIDLQLNGYRGIDFNSDELSAAALHRACELLQADGVSGVLATIITDDLDRMVARLAKLSAIRRGDPLVREIVWGLHIEGPFLNETTGYVGAHPPEHVLPASVEGMQRLLDAGDGLTRIVTLAPERDAGLQSLARSTPSGDRRRAVDVHASRQRLPDATAPAR